MDTWHIIILDGMYGDVENCEFEIKGTQSAPYRAAKKRFSLRDNGSTHCFSFIPTMRSRRISTFPPDLMVTIPVEPGDRRAAKESLQHRTDNFTAQPAAVCSLRRGTRVDILRRHKCK
jgi:hypothetical protein